LLVSRGVAIVKDDGTKGRDLFQTPRTTATDLAVSRVLMDNVGMKFDFAFVDELELFLMLFPPGAY